MVLGVLLCAVVIGSAKVDPAGQQLLTAAGGVVDIRGEDAKPFQLEMDFKVQFAIPQSGHLTLRWAGPKRWSQQITMEDYREVSIRSGENLYTSRNAPFTPLRLSELSDLAEVFSDDPDGWEVKKVKANGASVSCMEIRSKHHGEREICVDQVSKEVLSDERKEEQELRRKEFSAYQQFREHRYPRQLKLFVNGSLAVNAQVTSLQDASFDDAQFAPPPGAVVRRQCEHMQPPKPVKTPDPQYPASASQNRIQGTVTARLTVLPDGSVENIQLLGTATREMDRATQDALSRWKFKPALCGSEPMTFDITVEVSFRFRY